jgi:2-polyprenyl-3-methyl-5-hydroxy-6-metoxy-1,4-benzoquinol methylase
VTETLVQAHQNANNLLFQSFYKNVWRKLIPPGLTEAEADFIEDVADLRTQSHVLDIMCGYGRHAIALAKKGIRVTAIDNLPDYINEINNVAQQERLPLESKLEDVATTSFDGPYDAVICMGNCFSSFDYPRAINVLANITKSLKKGGVFIINSWMIAEIAIKHFEAKTWLYVDEYKYLLDNRFLFQPTRIETDHIVIHENGETQILKGVDYIFTFAELETMLANAGLKMMDVYSTPRKKKYSFGDNRAYILAKKVV